MAYFALEKYRFAADRPGPRLLLTGVVHGNEECGDIAMRRIMDDIEAGRIRLRRGSVTLMPVCNPLAYAQNTRFTNVDLNRDMRPKAHPVTYEDHLSNQICAEIEQAEAVLDVHSYAAGGPSFVFLGPPDEKEYDFARAIGSEYFIHSWQNAYMRGEKDAGLDKNDAGKKPKTTSLAYYAKENGVTSLTIECGQNGDPESIETAYNAMLNALEHWNTAEISPAIKRSPRATAQKIIELKTVFFKTAQCRIAKDFKNFEKVKRGDLIATFNASAAKRAKAIRAPCDGYSVLPYKNPPIGEKIMIYGVEQSKEDFFAKLKAQHKKQRNPAIHY